MASVRKLNAKYHDRRFRRREKGYFTGDQAIPGLSPRRRRKRDILRAKHPERPVSMSPVDFFDSYEAEHNRAFYY